MPLILFSMVRLLSFPACMPEDVLQACELRRVTVKKWGRR